MEENISKRVYPNGFFLCIMEESRDWFEQGVTLFEKGKYSRAIAAFDRALEINPSMYEAWNNRGLSLIHTEDYQEALISFNKVLNLNPGHENAKKAKKIVLERLEHQKKTNTFQESKKQSQTDKDSVARRSVPSPDMKKPRNPLLAIGSSLIIPGWGQWYNGRTWNGLKFFGLSFVCLVVLWIVSSFALGLVFADICVVILIGIWISGIYDAYRTAHRINKGVEDFSGKSSFFWLPVLIVSISVAGAAVNFLTVSGANQNTQVIKSFNYTLRGNADSITITMDSRVNTTISSKPAPVACLLYFNDSAGCYAKYIDEPDGKKYLDDMVRSIEEKTSNPDDQARIAISLVQTIPYDVNEAADVKSSTGIRGQYPYEVLYNDAGICQDKAFLLAYLLRGLGYGVILFDFPSQNHIAVGIKSPDQYSYEHSGYAFIETTTPSIPTDSEDSYIDVGKLASTPHLFPVSDGDSFSSISEEYQDAITLNQLENTGGPLAPERYIEWQALVLKYGLITNGGTPTSENS